jgi:cellulose synthase/poly-beta-1,6-N-acetylglucosamine synthase-like glycosyltransferase
MKQELSEVFVAIPTRSQINVELVPPLVKWLRDGASFYFDCSTLIDNARNQCVRAFLKSDKNYLCFVDSDMLPPGDSIERLLKHKKDIISGLHHAIYKYDENQAPTIGTSSFVSMVTKEDGQIERNLVFKDTGLQKVQGASTAFLLIHRNVFKDWTSPWFKFQWDAEHKDFIGEDYWFCLEAQRRGFEIFTDANVFIKHSKQVII